MSIPSECKEGEINLAKRIMAMTSKERILAAWRGEPHDHVPFTTWSFGFRPPQHLRWERDGQEVKYWFTKRLEHIHTLPQPWELEDDFQRVMTWQSIGVDDILDVSIPWSIDPEVTWKDLTVEAGVMDKQYPVSVRVYETPAGKLTHAIKQTGEDMGPGWVLQPKDVPLFEDFNIPRGVKHIVTEAEDIPAVQHLYCPPDADKVAWFESRMEKVKAFADKYSVPVQAWSAFGMDGMIWMTGVQEAIYMAMDAPGAFAQLFDTITETDAARTALAARHPGIDMVVERGWYSSTEFWSPRLLEQTLFPHISSLAKVAHEHNKLFGYVMTTGIDKLGKQLADAGVDVLYFLDPHKDAITLEKARDWLGGQITLVGGVSTLTLDGPASEIERKTADAMEILGKTNRFILHPVDSIYPNTSWEGLETMIETWRKFQ
jgi:hypothetical protein